MDKIIARLKKKTVEIIKKSSNPEDPIRKGSQDISSPLALC